MINNDQQLQAWFNVTVFKAICPKDCCRDGSYDKDCYRTIDNSGQSILPDEEIMLIYGGITSRKRYINGTTTEVFDECELYDEKFNMDAESRPYNMRNCAEEILPDIWRYHIKRNVWTFIKIDFNRQAYASLKAPSARYAMAGSYVQLDSKDETLST